MARCLLVLSLVVLWFASSCSPSPVEVGKGKILEAQAAATRSATEITQANAYTDLDIRKAAADAELKAKEQEIEARRQRAIVDTKIAEEQGQAKADGARQIAIAQADATRKTWEAVGQGSNWLLTAIGIGLSLSVVIFTTGRTAARTYGAILRARNVLINVEPSTLLPPPFIITDTGYLIDTRTGERARIRDAAGVNRLRLAASTQTTNIALGMRAAQQIAKDNRGKQSGGVRVAEALPEIGRSIPLLDVGEQE